MERAQLMKEIYAASHLTGEFLLRSGQISNEYFDKYLFEANPTLLEAIAEQMETLIPAECNALAGLEMGAIPVVTMLSHITKLPAAFVRKTAKEYGTKKASEGTDLKGKNVIIVEDVVTTGGQIILSAQDILNEGANIIGVLCVILRDPKAYDILSAKGLRLIPLFTMDEIKEAVEQ